MGYRHEQQHRHPPRQRVPREANQPIVEFPDDDDDDEKADLDQKPIQKEDVQQTQEPRKENELRYEKEERYHREKPSKRPDHYQNDPNHPNSNPSQQYERRGNGVNYAYHTRRNSGDFGGNRRSKHVDSNNYTRSYYQDEIPGYGQIGQSSYEHDSQRTFLKRRGNSRLKPTEKPSRYVIVRKNFDESLHRNNHVDSTDSNPVNVEYERSTRIKSDFTNKNNPSKVKSENDKPFKIDSKSKQTDRKPSKTDNQHSRFQKESRDFPEKEGKAGSKVIDTDEKTSDSNKHNTELNPDDTSEDLNPWINSHLWEI